MLAALMCQINVLTWHIKKMVRLQKAFEILLVYEVLKVWDLA